MQVTARNLAALPDGLHRLERGVYCRVRGVKRSFILRYSLHGRRRDVGLGGIDQTINAVRAKAAKYRALIADGRDPVEEKELARIRNRRAAERGRPCRSVPFFRDFYLDAISHTAYLRQWRGQNAEIIRASLIRRHVLPALGDMRLDAIKPEDVARALSPIWAKDLGVKALLVLKAIFDCAVTKEWMKTNPAEWKNGLSRYLPSRAVLRRGRPAHHHHALTVDGLRNVMQVLKDTETAAAKAVMFGALVVGRASEYSQARWSEIDLEKGEFVVPPGRRKDGRSEYFRVPLPRQAVALLKSMPRLGPYVFTAREPHALHPASVLWAMKKVAGPAATLHGMRSTFSDWCARNNKPYLVSEKCLMHNVGGAVFMAYQRDDLIEQRRILLQEWADTIFPD